MTPRILVLDDDPEIRDFLDAFLKSKGAEAVASDFPNNIVDLVERIDPNVVLIDFKNRSNPWPGHAR